MQEQKRGPGKVTSFGQPEGAPAGPAVPPEVEPDLCGAQLIQVNTWQLLSAHIEFCAGKARPREAGRGVYDLSIDAGG